MSGLLIDIALAITVAELIVLAVLRRPGNGAGRWGSLANLGAGIFLMLGIRAVLGGAAWPWLAACLTAAGTAHLTDMMMRRRSS